jgi:glutamate 5-kinase
MSNRESRKNMMDSVRRVVLKLGSSVVTTGQGLDLDVIRGLVDNICELSQEGKEFIIVSSGAIAAGVRWINLREGARTIPQKQAAASIGQSRLMATYEEAFGRHGMKVAQMLLTKDDLAHRRRYLNARNTLTTLLGWGVVPIINENDTVMVEEIQLGDNDNLSALVATLADADLLIALTDMEGLMDCDPRTSSEACLIPLVEEVTPDIKNLAYQPGPGVGKGGMASKLEAAAKAGASGIPSIIAGGKIGRIVPRILNAEACGTLVLPAKAKLSARKHWILYNLEPEGVLVIDDGAATALCSQGRSLLPIGVVQVSGDFEHGAAVVVQDAQGKTLSKGLVNYSSVELRKIKGHRTAEIDWILGFHRNDEAIHVDNLVLAGDAEE